MHKSRNLPKRLYLEITNRCNLACPFCLRTNRPIEDLSLALIEKVMRESRAITEYLYLHVQGEPLLHPEFPQILELAGKYRRRIQLVTNGVLLGKYQDILLDSTCIRKVSISLQGLFLASELSSKLETLEKFVEKASDRRMMIELRIWAKEKSEIIDFVRERFGIESAGVTSGKIKDNLYLSCKEEFQWPSLNLPVNDERHYCLGPKLMVCVLSDGTITPCCLDGEGLITLGNIRDISLSEAWVSSRYLAMIAGFKENKAVEKLCRHCYYLSSYEEA